MFSNSCLVSPDGLFVWKVNKWIEYSPGTSQIFNWNGPNWEPINPKDRGLALSTDGENLWTGKNGCQFHLHWTSI